MELEYEGYFEIEPYEDSSTALSLKQSDFIFSEMFELAKEHIEQLKKIQTITEERIQFNNEQKKLLKNYIKKLQEIVKDIELQNEVGKVKISYYDNVIEHLIDCTYPININQQASN